MISKFSIWLKPYAYVWHDSSLSLSMLEAPLPSERHVARKISLYYSMYVCVCVCARASACAVECVQESVCARGINPPPSSLHQPPLSLSLFEASRQSPNAPLRVGGWRQHVFVCVRVLVCAKKWKCSRNAPTPHTPLPFLSVSVSVSVTVSSFSLSLSPLLSCAHAHALSLSLFLVFFFSLSLSIFFCPSLCSKHQIFSSFFFFYFHPPTPPCEKGGGAAPDPDK